MVSKSKIHAQAQTLPGSEAAMNPAAEMIRDGYKGADKLAGKVALITGGDSGIGRSVAIHFAREGADVAIAYLCETEDANKAKRLVEAEGRRCHLIEGNLSDANFCRLCIDETVDNLGGINVLVNNAGTQWVSEDLTELPDEQWHRMFEVNMHSQFYLAKAALPHLREGDSIINCASINAYVGPEILVDYSATKGAIISFTRSLSNQVVGRGIRVNAVAPGPVWTPLQPATLGAHNPQWLEGFGEDTPMGRAGQPSELGPVFVFLACQDASFISGQTIHPNGGTIVNG